MIYLIDPNTTPANEPCVAKGCKNLIKPLYGIIPIPL